MMIEDFGINLIDKDKNLIIDTLKWNGLAKKKGFQTDDIIDELKIENSNRPDKDIVYPFALLCLGLIGFYNFRKKV